MKILRTLLLAIVALTVLPTEAKPLKTNQVYMFGFSASFKDSVVYVTDIQNVEGAWIETKTKFLMERENYSYQLKSYLEDTKQQSNRICMVFFELSKKKAEKQPKTKAEKAAMIGGGVALGVGVLGLVGKALLGAAASYADEDSDGGYSDDVALLDGEVSEAADSVELETAYETTEDVEA